MLRSTACLALLVVAACGSEIEPASNQPPATSQTPAPAPSTSDPKQEEKEEEEAPVVGPLVTFKNTASAPRWIKVDGQSTPVEFEIGQPPLQLNGYGSYWCNGPKDNHNDPFFRLAKVEPGEAADVYWRAISVTREGDCWRGKAFEAGSYPTKACFYESDPTGVTNPAKTCVDATLTIPASGAAELAF